MKVFVLLKLMPLFWQGHAQDENFLIQMGKKNIMGLGSALPTCTGKNYVAWATEGDSYQCSNSHSDIDICSTIGNGLKICPSDTPVCTGYEAFRSWGTCKAPQAGAYGDPHCVNAKGDWFDIHAVGRIPMVILPLGTRIEEGDFAVIATTTTPDGWDKCAPTFISAVDVWANQAHDQLRVDAGPAGDLQVKPMNGSTEAYSIKMLSEKVMITFRSVIVSVILNKVPKIDQAPFLYFDMEVAGLQALKAGGILGADPHDFAQVQPDGCSEVPFKHRAVDRYSMARAMP